MKRHLGQLCSIFAGLVVGMALIRSSGAGPNTLAASELPSRPKIILDTDTAGMILTGLDVDDDLAILNALSLHHHLIIDLLGITITGGNAPIRYTYPNALDLIRHKAGLSEDEIGIYRGGSPLTREIQLKLEKNIGSLTDSGTTIPADLASDATRYLIDTIMNSEEKTITLLCIGPLTNIASAFLIEPQIAEKIRRVVCMGGTLTDGLPYDLNIRTDPVAAAIIWNDMNCEKIMLPIETCLQAIFGADQLKEVEGKCPKGQDFNVDEMPIVCSFLTRLRVQRYLMPWVVNWRYLDTKRGIPVSTNFRDGFVLWDLVALWAAVRPDLFANWTHFHANLLPQGSKNILGFYGPQIEWSSPQSGRRVFGSEELFTYRNEVLMPLKLKNESDLHRLIFDHLWLPAHTMSSNEIKRRRLSFWCRLGGIPSSLGLAFILCLFPFVLLRRRHATTS